MRDGFRAPVKMVGATTEEVEVRYPKGGEKFPLTDREIVEKYDRLAALVMKPRHAADLKEMVLDLARCKDVGELSRLLATDVASPFRE